MPLAAVLVAHGQDRRKGSFQEPIQRRSRSSSLRIYLSPVRGESNLMLLFEESGRFVINKEG
ncbi:hypothetical protein V6L77_00005, partial [Pannonibacter sp. Pt2-lr]